MKNLLKINLMALLMLAFCTIGTAQDQPQRLSREQLAEKQARHIAHELAFDDATTQQFIETYCAYQQEVWALGPRPQNEPGNDEETEQAIRERFERSQAILDLREKYYEEYSKFLAPRQIQRVYELERQTMNRLARHRGNGRSPRRHHHETERQ